MSKCDLCHQKIQTQKFPVLAGRKWLCAVPWLHSGASNRSQMQLYRPEPLKNPHLPISPPWFKPLDLWPVCGPCRHCWLHQSAFVAQPGKQGQKETKAAPGTAAFISQSGFHCYPLRGRCSGSHTLWGIGCAAEFWEAATFDDHIWITSGEFAVNGFIWGFLPEVWTSPTQLSSSMSQRSTDTHSSTGYM